MRDRGRSFRYVTERPLLLTCALVCACRDWDAFDPRLGEGGDPTSSSSSSMGGGGSGDGGDGEGGLGGVPAGGGGAGGSPLTGGGGAGVGGEGGGTGGAGGSGVTVVDVPSAVADCIDPAAPDPDACEAFTEVGIMTADQMVTGAGAAHIFMRFDLDGSLAGATILSASVRLHVPVHVSSDSDHSGALWLCDPFDRADLFVAAPSTQGATPLAPDQGAVAQGATVDFPIPTAMVTPNTSLYFSILPQSTNGVDYYNKNGLLPVSLHIQYQ